MKFITLIALLCLSILTAIVFIGSLSYTPAGAYSTNMSASNVVGQPNLTSRNIGGGNLNPGATGFDYVAGVVVIGGKLIVTDSNNNRVLIFNTIPTTDFAAADVVIGQSNMTSYGYNQGLSVSAQTLGVPTKLATDGTKLIISDYGNNRVLIYNTVPTTNNAAADVVIGQANMTQSGVGTAADRLRSPQGVFYDNTSGKLLISDMLNNRVLIYNSLPTTNGASADIVLGQSDFTSNVNGTGAAGLHYPYDAKIIANKLIAADQGNNRVMIWNTVPTTDGAAADVVIGQPDFTSYLNNQGGSVSASTLYYPATVAYNAGKLFVGDYQNHRILIYNSIPNTNNVAADAVLGQVDFVSNNANQGAGLSGATASTLYYPEGGIVFSGTQLFIGDSSNNRVLIFNDDSLTPAPTSNNSSSQNSSSIQAPTCSLSSPERAPYLSSVDTATSSATLRFTSAGANSTYHLISYSLTNTAEQFGVSIPLGNFSDTFSYTISNLSPNTRYYFKVRGGNGCQPGQWSSILTGVTKGTTSNPQITPTPVAKEATQSSTPAPTSLSTPAPRSTTPAQSLTEAERSNAASQREESTSQPKNTLVLAVSKIKEDIKETISGSVLLSRTYQATENALVGGTITGLVLYSTTAVAQGVQPALVVVQSASALNTSSITVVRSLFAQAVHNFFNFILGLFGLRKRKQKTHGIIFDSISNEPLNNALVILYSAQGALKTSVTNKEGRFSFNNINPGEYQIKVTKNDYDFPSRIMIVSQNEDYRHIYKEGERLTLSGEPTSGLAIPLDKKTFQKAWYIYYPLSVVHYISYIFSTYYYPIASSSLLLSVLLCAINPSSLNLVTLEIITISLLFNIWTAIQNDYAYGTIVDFDNKVLPQMLVQLCTLENGIYNIYTNTYSDRKGRYIFTPEDGEYALRVRDQTFHLLVEEKVIVNKENPIVNMQLKID